MDKGPEVGRSGPSLGSAGQASLAHVWKGDGELGWENAGF